MGRKKKPENNYFHSGIEEAILLYNESESDVERNRLFRVIYPALHKISEVMFNKIKPTYMTGDPLEIQMDCATFLSEKLPMIKEGKGKAFSYMTVTARNFYIYWNTKSYNETKKTVSLDYVNENWDIEDKDSNRVEEMEESAKLLHAFADYLEKHKDSFSTGQTRKSLPVVNAVIDLIRNIDNIEDFNRRNIMNNLTEINGMKIDRHYITKMFNRLEVHYGAFKKEWIDSKNQIDFLKSELSKEDIEFCINNYAGTKGKYSIVGLAKKFNVEEYAVRKELFRAGLCSI